MTSSLLLILALVLVLSTTAPSMVAAQVWSDVEESIDIEFSPLPMTRAQLDAVEESQLYPLRQSDGSLFVCHLPDTHTIRGSAEGAESYESGENDEADDDDDDDASTRIEDIAFEQEDPVPAAVMHRLDTVLSARPCFNSNAGWWKYELCWGRYVRQYHVEPYLTTDPEEPIKLNTTAENWLGFSLAEWNARRGGQSGGVSGTATGVVQQFFSGSDVDGRFIQTTYRDGDDCSLAEAPRETVIRLYCSSGKSRFHEFSVKESGTCRYEVSLILPEACLHGLEPTVVHSKVICYPFGLRQ